LRPVTVRGAPADVNEVTVPGRMSTEPAQAPDDASERARAYARASARPATRWWGRPLAETRWVLELSRLVIDPVFAGRDVLRGGGRPVILMPGFLAGDQTLGVMAAWLYRIGYRPHVCGFILNVSCSDQAVERLERRIESVARRHGSRVALIGHSRGGHYARALAARRPDLVSHAISIGGDLQGMLGCSAPTLSAVAGLRAILRSTGRAGSPDCLTDACRCPFMTDFYAPFPNDRVRLTSIYSRGDGVVLWQRQIVSYADCVEVTGSHVGLAFNRKTYRAIADALATPELQTRLGSALPESRRAA
jgi:triacylglycerol lipase